MELTKVIRGEKGFRAEFRGPVVRQNSSVLSVLNAGDERFDNNSMRFAWATCTAKAINEHFGVPMLELEAMKDGDEKILNIQNPEIAGNKCSIKIEEYQEPRTDYERDNWEKAAKQLEITQNVLQSTKLKKSSLVYDALGEQGYFMANGRLIFSNATVVFGNTPEHSFIENATLHSIREVKAALSKSVTLVAEGSKVLENANAPKQGEI